MYLYYLKFKLRGKKKIYKKVFDRIDYFLTDANTNQGVPLAGPFGNLPDLGSIGGLGSGLGAGLGGGLGAGLGAGFPNLANLGLLGSLGSGAAGAGTGAAPNLTGNSQSFVDLHNQMQTEIMNNPEFLREVLSNPLVQSLMTNPENMRTLITSNPQMQELMEVSNFYTKIITSCRNILVYVFFFRFCWIHRIFFLISAKP